ncbi:MAG: VanZ family protein, partial [Bacilli bacterium]|nr:VanZ family protein [Bacilli bacterium]
MITPLDHTVRGVMEFTWPMIIICTLIISSLRIADIIMNKKEVVFYREILMLFFMIYILCLFQIVTFEDPLVSSYEDHFNLIPFKEISRYLVGSRLFFKNVIGNLVMFMPYGFFAAYFTKLDSKYYAFSLIAFASITIETTQLAIGRVFDIDDIILNIIGGMIGYGIYRLLSKIGNSLPKVFQNKWLLNILSLVITGILVGYLWMVI